MKICMLQRPIFSISLCTFPLEPKKSDGYCHVNKHLNNIIYGQRCKVPGPTNMDEALRNAWRHEYLLAHLKSKKEQHQRHFINGNATRNLIILKEGPL